MSLGAAVRNCLLWVGIMGVERLSSEVATSVDSQAAVNTGTEVRSERTVESPGALF